MMAWLEAAVRTVRLVAVAPISCYGTWRTEPSAPFACSLLLFAYGSSTKSASSEASLMLSSLLLDAASRE